MKSITAILSIFNRNDYTFPCKGNISCLLFKLFFILGACCLFVNPYISCIVFFCIAIILGNVKCSNFNKWIVYAMVVSGLFVVSFVNMTKIPENDLVWYIQAYQYGSTYKFSDYILFGSSMGDVSGKEPIYAAFVWIMNRFFSGNVDLFKFFMSFVEYSFLSISMIYLGKKFNWTISTIAMGLILIFFLPIIFTMSLQLVRQFLASCVVVLVIVLACFSDIRKSYIVLLSLLPPFIHSTAFLFPVFIFLPALEHSYKEKKIWYISAFLLLSFIQIIAAQTSIFVGEGSSLGYALSRASRDTTFDLGTMGMSKIFFLMAVVLLSIYVGQFSGLKKIRGVVRFCNIVSFGGIFVLMNLKQSELSGRMFFYITIFIPFLLMLSTLIGNKMKYVALTLCFFFLLYFPTFLQTGIWQYDLPCPIWQISVLDFFRIF